VNRRIWARRQASGMQETGQVEGALGQNLKGFEVGRMEQLVGHYSGREMLERSCRPQSRSPLLHRRTLEEIL